jgi:hypothetical protein
LVAIDYFTKWIKAILLKIVTSKNMYLHQNLEEEWQGLESSQDHVIKESIAGRLVSADSNAALESVFLR